MPVCLKIFHTYLPFHRKPSGPWAKYNGALGASIKDEVTRHVCPVDTPGAWSDSDLQEMKDRIMLGFQHKKDDAVAVSILLEKVRDRIRNVRCWTMALLKHIRVDNENIDEETLRCMFSEFFFYISIIMLPIYLIQQLLVCHEDAISLYI